MPDHISLPLEIFSSIGANQEKKEYVTTVVLKELSLHRLVLEYIFFKKKHYLNVSF